MGAGAAYCEAEPAPNGNIFRKPTPDLRRPLRGHQQREAAASLPGADGRFEIARPPNMCDRPAPAARSSIGGETAAPT